MTKPSWCVARHPLNANKAVGIRRNEAGYYPLESHGSLDTINRELGVSPAEREAMLAGSIFGWDAPLAQAEMHQDAKPYDDAQT
jgi:hypothetical protein